MSHKEPTSREDIPEALRQQFVAENGDLLVTAPFTKEQLENAQTYEPATYKANPDAVLLKG